ncbi:unnamed protein product [Caenorhabditis sp. 36 PRJEB53466]|nr:unnamed protein product [Caenorhabditis sp. 36 PRJEB53466]
MRSSFALFALLLLFETANGLGSATIRLRSAEKLMGFLRIVRADKTDIIEPLSLKGTDRSPDELSHWNPIHSTEGFIAHRNAFANPITFEISLFKVDSTSTFSTPIFYNFTLQPFDKRKVLAFLYPSLMLEIDFKCGLDWAGSLCDKPCDYGPKDCNWYGCIVNYANTPICQKPLCAGDSTGADCTEKIDRSAEVHVAPVRFTDNFDEMNAFGGSFHSDKQYIVDPSDNYQLELEYN